MLPVQSDLLEKIRIVGLKAQVLGWHYSGLKRSPAKLQGVGAQTLELYDAIQALLGQAFGGNQA